MATITLNETFPPTTKSVLSITESSRTSEKTKFNLSVKTNLVSSTGYVGTTISLYGKVEISGTGITTQSKTLTLKKSSEDWRDTSVHTTTGTFEVNIPANVNSIKVKYTIWYSDVSDDKRSSSTTMSITKLVSQLNAFSNNNTLDIEQPLILSITEYDEAYTSNLKMKVSGTPILTLNNVVDGQEITLTQDQIDNIYSLSPNNTFDIEWVLETYSGDTLLGEMNLTSTGVITNANPIFSDFDFEDIDIQVIALTGGANYVKGYSDIKISNLIATAQKQSTIKYWNINNNLIENTGSNEIILENHASNSITIYAVDSRGNSTPLTKPIQNFIEYYKLTKGNQDNERINNVTEQVSISFEGDFFECDFGNKQNELKVSYKYKKTNDSEYITGETIITPTIENNKYSFSGLIKGDTDNGFDIGSSYNIGVEVSDELSKVEYSYVIQAGIPAFAVFGNKMAIGDMYDESKSEYNVQLWNKVLVNGIDFDKLFNDTGWRDFSWTNSSYIGTTQSSYTRNQWRVKDNILYIFIGVGSTSTINTSDEIEVARIPITNVESITGSRVWNGAVGATGSYGGFFVGQEEGHISIYMKPHTTANGQTGKWFSSYFAIPLDDDCSINI